MRRLIAVAATAVALVAVPTSAHAYDRACGGILDTGCHGVVCPMDCFGRECLIWIDVFHSPVTAQCIGPVVQPS
jgi:hypothetical protein